MPIPYVFCCIYRQTIMKSVIDLLCPLGLETEIMHPNFALTNEVSMIIRDLEVVNRLRRARRGCSQRNARPGARDDA